MNRKRLAYVLLSVFSFILGCTLTLFALHATALKSNALPQGPKYKLLVLVVSAVKNRERRDAIRETWGRPDGNVGMLFAVSRHRRLSAEKLVHGDILEVDAPDEYRSLSRKLLAAFSGVRAVRFEYLLKCDDDTFVDVPGVVGELERAPDDKFYWGYFDGDAHVKRTGKWKETGWILCDKYLPYALGGGYVLSKDLVVYIVNNMDYLRCLPTIEISYPTTIIIIIRGRGLVALKESPNVHWNIQNNALKI